MSSANKAFQHKLLCATARRHPSPQPPPLNPEDLPDSPEEGKSSPGEESHQEPANQPPASEDKSHVSDSEEEEEEEELEYALEHEQNLKIARSKGCFACLYATPRCRAQVVHSACSNCLRAFCFYDSRGSTMTGHDFWMKYILKAKPGLPKPKHFTMLGNFWFCNDCLSVPVMSLSDQDIERIDATPPQILEALEVYSGFKSPYEAIARLKACGIEWSLDPRSSCQLGVTPSDLVKAQGTVIPLNHSKLPPAYTVGRTFTAATKWAFRSGYTQDDLNSIVADEKKKYVADAIAKHVQDLFPEFDDESIKEATEVLCKNLSKKRKREDADSESQ